MWRVDAVGGVYGGVAEELEGEDVVDGAAGEPWLDGAGLVLQVAEGSVLAVCGVDHVPGLEVPGWGWSVPF